MEYALSARDLLELVDYNANLVLYEDLINYKGPDALDELLDPYGVCIILYQTKRNFGHWCCIIRHGKHRIEFFDSYGEKPDVHLATVSTYYKKVLNEDFPYLTALLYEWILKDRRNKVEFNEIQYQSYGQGDDRIATCGRHVGTRILLRDLPLKKYQELIGGAIKDIRSGLKTNLAADRLVTAYTNIVRGG